MKTIILKQLNVKFVCNLKVELKVRRVASASVIVQDRYYLIGNLY